MASSKKDRLVKYYSEFNRETLAKSITYYMNEIESINNNHSVHRMEAILENFTSRLEAIRQALREKQND